MFIIYMSGVLEVSIFLRDCHRNKIANPKNKPAITYITKLAYQRLPVIVVSQYWITSNPRGLKNRAIIMLQFARRLVKFFDMSTTVSFHYFKIRFTIISIQMEVFHNLFVVYRAIFQHCKNTTIHI